MVDSFKPWLLLLLVLLLLLSLAIAHDTKPEQGGESPQRGINYVAWQPEQYSLPSLIDDLEHLKSLGVGWVAIVVTWYQADRQATEITSDAQLSPKDEEVVHVLRQLRKLGLRAFLRPMVDIKDGSWRGEITFNTETDWEAWFQSYERFLLHYAELAAREGVALFSVGVELESTVHREPQWRELIARVRRIFAGPITYSANWDGFKRVPFWDMLNYVGIDAYFELESDPDAEPTLDTLIAAWQPWVRRLERFATQVRKPILFTEIGVRSIRGASRRPWDWRYEALISLQEQANYYEATFRVFWQRPWLAGFYIWTWLPGLGGQHDTSYTPAGKPAEEVLKRWYLQQY